MSREEIDAAIARHSEQELLFDQPYEDRKIVRVCGPFTVESLSPHRMLDRATTLPDDRGSVAEPDAVASSRPSSSNLRKAGVQNHVRAALEFDRSSPTPAQWIHARAPSPMPTARRAGRGLARPGVRHGRLRPGARRPRRRSRASASICCSSAASLSTRTAARPPRSSARRRRRLGGRGGGAQVRPAAGAARPHEPGPRRWARTCSRRPAPATCSWSSASPTCTSTAPTDGQIEVEVRGVDVYDPTTGEIRSDSTDDIACWFIDTNYNGESFFVRDAYFTGANDPYKRLRQALKADIDEEAWASLYRDAQPPVRSARRPARSPSRSSTTTATRSSRPIRSPRRPRSRRFEPPPTVTLQGCPPPMTSSPTATCPARPRWSTRCRVTARTSGA